MVKGHKGETCSKAIRECFQEGERLTYTKVIQRVSELGDWELDTINQNLMGNVVNQIPARKHWPSKKPFLFLHGDARYELYDENKHPIIVE